jgi:Transglutaminase-like superfamily
MTDPYFRHSSSPAPDTLLASDAPAAWLSATRLLDLEDSKLRIQAMRLTQLAQTDAHKAVLIHDFIKAMPFGCVVGFDHIPAGSVLRSGRGDCHTKGTLFVALLRCAGVPARLRFVTLPGTFLRGIMDIGPGGITHAIGEVFLDGAWLQTDTYVTDSVLEEQARALLTREGRECGLGIHLRANRFWDAKASVHGQFTPTDPASLPTHDWGVAHDPAAFYAEKSHPQLDMSWLSRAKYMVGAQVVNKRCQAVRENTLAA